MFNVPRTHNLVKRPHKLTSAKNNLTVLYHKILLFFGQVELPPADLGPTASLTQTLTLLREVLASHDSSMVPLDARQADFAQVSLHLI